MASDKPPVSGGEEWRQYLEAARRKVKIADYHQQCLAAENAKEHFKTVTIPIQANFEGILFAFAAATDKTAEAINRAMRFNVHNAKLETILKNPNCPLRDRLARWNDAPITSDARKLRNRITHRYYMKVPSESGLEIQQPFGSARSSYKGSRDVMSYGEAAVDHLRALPPILDQLEDELDGLLSVRPHPSRK